MLLVSPNTSFSYSLFHSYILMLTTFNIFEIFRGLVNIPGTSLLAPTLLAFAYFVFLIWLFFGIAIVADIFMEAIEVITS